MTASMADMSPMSKLVMQKAFLWSLVAGLGTGWAQTSAPKATPAALAFTYLVNSATLPPAQTVQITVPSTLTNSTLMVQSVSTPQGWLTATPGSGRAPLSLTIIVNPTGLGPGSYSGSVTVTSALAGSNPAIVSVTLSITNPPATVLISSPSTNYTSPPPALAFSYTTGAPSPTPANSEIDVSSTGDTIPFNVTVANVASSGGGKSTTSWLLVNGANQPPGTQTSGVAFSGSFVPITVSLDPITLGSLSPGSYGATITIAGTNSANGSATVGVTLVVAAGPPTITSTFPTSIIASPVVNPVVTIYGDNFFSTSVVTLQAVGSSVPPITLNSTLLSRQVLTATIPAATLSAPGSWTLAVTNPAPPTNPSQAPATTTLTVTSATQPLISAIVNAADYLPTAIQSGTGPNPVPLGATSVSPREIVAIFGQNLGPASITAATPTGTPLTFPTILANIEVAFQIGAAGVSNPPVLAPITMVSSNQINAVVPVAVASVIGQSPNTVTVQIVNTASSTTTPPFTVTVVPADPGMFTIGGLGKGQGAVLNYDASTGSYVINSTKNAAPRGSTIVIYATGLGDLNPPPADGVVPTTAVPLAANTTRVDIAGQPAVVSYAGATPGAVAGLVQINAIIPPTVSTGQAIPISVSVGSTTTARTSQAGVTIAVK